MLSRLRQAGVELAERDGKLLVRNPAGLTDQQREWLRDHRDGLIKELQREQATVWLYRRDPKKAGYIRTTLMTHDKAKAQQMLEAFPDPRPVLDLHRATTDPIEETNEQTTTET